MNLLANAGFEIVGTAPYLPASWECTTSPIPLATRETSAARSGVYGLRVSRAAWPPVFPPSGYAQGQAEQHVTVRADALYALEIQARRASGLLVFGELLADGTRIARATDVNGWQVLSGLVTPAGADLSVRVALSVEGGAANAAWDFDDARLEEVPVARGFEFAYRALWNRLATIDGAAGGYWHDLGGRIFARDRAPVQGGTKLPYACLPVDDAGQWEEHPRGFTATLDQSVVVYLERRSKTDLESSSALDALRMTDDLMRCLLPDGPVPVWNLGDPQILEVKLLERDIVVPDPSAKSAHPYVELRLGIVFTADRDSLGPSAS